MYAVQAADSDDLAALGDPARDGRAIAMERRRQLSQGKQAPNGGGDGMAGAAAGTPPAASDGQGAPSGAPGALGGELLGTHRVTPPSD